MTSKDRKTELYAELSFIGHIQGKELQELVERVWLHAWELSGLHNLNDASWFTMTRNEYERGTALVQHIREVAASSLALTQVARAQGQTPDKDLVLAGAALIDVDKLFLIDHASGRIRSPGSLPHAYAGAHLATEEGAGPTLTHIILSHSKNTQIRPQTLEAVIVHYADYAVFDMRNIHERRETLAAEQRPLWSRVS